MRTVFDTLRYELNAAMDDAPMVEVYVAPAADFPGDRDYAYCHTEPDAQGFYRVGTAPKMEEAVDSRAYALIAHEIGHAVLLHAGIPTHSEKEADQMAEALFDMQISYDADDVQTLDAGQRPRPAHLPR